MSAFGQFILTVLAFIGSIIGAWLRYGDRSQSTLFTNDNVLLDTTSLGPDISTQPMWQKARQQIEDLQKIDPNFNEVGFLAYAASAYVRALTIEGAMDPNGAHDVETASYAACVAKRIDEWNSQGLRRVVSDLRLDGTTLFKISLDGQSESLVVRVSGRGVRYTQDIATGVAAEGSNQSETFTEFATFVRPAGAVTPKTAQLGGPTHCPSCGAPAPMSATKCEFCGTPLTASSAPWLLDHISQSAYT